MSSATTTAAADGARQAGAGDQVTIPRHIPHVYNDHYSVRLTYADSIGKDVTPGTGSYHVFATNSIYDPDVTGTGHQPLGRDLWVSQYEYYTVLACHYRIEVWNCARDSITYTAVGTSNQLVPGVSCTILPTTNAADIVNAASGTVYPAMEMKNTQTQVSWPGGIDPVVFTGTLTPGDFMPDAKDADSDNTWVAAGSNPGILRYLGIILNPTISGTLTGQNKTPYARMQFVVTLDYDVQFNQVAASYRYSAN